MAAFFQLSFPTLSRTFYDVSEFKVTSSLKLRKAMKGHDVPRNARTWHIKEENG